MIAVPRRRRAPRNAAESARRRAATRVALLRTHDE
tara:strand:- start:130 stop:234 length:105 start_codon:yes stop_codon:yes gene_type:complete